MICECCWYIKGIEVPAPHWMEWDEWLCSECADQALEESCHTEETSEAGTDLGAK